MMDRDGTSGIIREWSGLLTVRKKQTGDLKMEPIDYNDDVNQEDPVDLTSEEWSEFYHKLDDYEDYLDHDMSMNY